MSHPKLQNRQGATIADWRDWTPPKDPNHWKAGRSAMELARAWFTSRSPQCPAEIEALLATNSITSPVQFLDGVPEAITGLPGGGGGRNHDLLLKGEINGQKVIASIEGKADERFGNSTVKAAWNRARASIKPTKVDKRIENLLEMIFGTQARPDQAPWNDLRYQLLTGVAATAIEASRYSTIGQPAVGLFLVHEFHTHFVTKQNIQANAADYAHFAATLLNISASTIQEGQMYGPQIVGPNHFLTIPVEIFIGKAVFKWN